MMKNLLTSSLCGLAAGLLSLVAMTDTAKADPASPAGENAIYEKINDIRRNATDSTNLSKAYAGTYCHHTNGGTPQMAPDGVGAYIGLFNQTTNSLSCAIYWSPSTGAHAIWGTVFTRFAAGQYEVKIGYPLGDTQQINNANVNYQEFELLNGGRTAIFGSSLGTFAINGPHDGGSYVWPVLSSWRATNAEFGAGYPATELRGNGGMNLCHPGVGRGCTTGEDGSTNFTAYQPFAKYNRNTARWTLTCACVIGDASRHIEWRVVNDNWNPGAPR